MASDRSRRSVLFLPGLLCDAELWSFQAEALLDISDPTIADLTCDDDVGGMAARALANAPPSFDLIALSMGGYVAFEVLRQAPERVTSLVLLGTSAGLDDPERIAKRRAGIEALKIGRFLGVTDRLLPQLIHPSRLEDPLADRIKAMAARVGSDGFVCQQKAILSRQDSIPLLSRIAVPTLVGVGDADVLTPPAESRRIHEGIKNSKLHVFRECGHLPPLELPRQTTDLLRNWLTEHASSLSCSAGGNPIGASRIGG